MLGGTDDTGGKGGLELKLGGERFGLRAASRRRRGGIIIFVFEICGIPDPRSMLLFDCLDWLVQFVVFFTRGGVRLSDGWMKERDIRGGGFHVSEPKWIVG